MSPPAKTADPGEITALLQQARRGEAAAFQRLVPLVYDALKELSRRQLRRRAGGQTLCTTDLVHEAYVKLARPAPVDWQDRAPFFGVAARAMRQVLADHARRRLAGRRAAARNPLTFTGGRGSFQMDLTELLTLDAALERLDALNSRLRRVVELRFFAGMPEQDIAEVLGVSTRTVERDWVKARLFLHREMYGEDQPG